MALLHHIPPGFGRVERLPADLSNGGVVLLVLGKDDDIPTDFAYHPRVKPLDMERVDAKSVESLIPSNVRAAVFAPGKASKKGVFRAVHDVLKKRRVPYMLRDNNEAVRQEIENLLPKDAPRKVDIKPTASASDAPSGEPPSEAQREIAKRGSVKALVEAELPKILAEHPQIANAEAGRRLFGLAQDRGIMTTLGSLEQAARVYKRDHSVGTRPESATPPEQRVANAVTSALVALDEATALVKKVAAEYERVVAENAKLAAQNEKAREVFQAFKGDVFGES